VCPNPVPMAAWDLPDTFNSSALNLALRQELHVCMRSMQAMLVDECASKVDACQQHFDKHATFVQHVLQQGKQQQDRILQGIDELVRCLLPVPPGSTELQPLNVRSVSGFSHTSDRAQLGTPPPQGRGSALRLVQLPRPSGNACAIPPINEPLTLSDSMAMDDLMPHSSFQLPGQAPDHSEVETGQEREQTAHDVNRLMSAASTLEAVTTKQNQRREWDQHMRRSGTQFLDKHRELVESCASTVETPRPSSFVRLVEHASFQWCCAAVIISSALFEGYMADVRIRLSLISPEQLDPSWFMPVATFLTVLYSIEVLCRLVAYCKLFFTGLDKCWNIFDLTLVLLSTLEYIQFYVGVGSVAFIRGLRLLRMIRVIRVLGVFRDLRLMICMVSQSLWSLFWGLLLIALILYLHTVIILQGLIFKLRNNPESTADPAFMDDVTNLYGSVWVSLFTLLGSITGGIDWIEATACLQEIGLTFRVIYCFFIFFTVIGVLNVLTGVFVERASELCGLDKDLVIQNQLKRNQTFLTEMTKLFKEANVSNTGTLGWHEFRDYLQDERAQAFFATQQLDSFDARTLFDVLNSGGLDHEISMDEFIVGCQRLKGQARSVELIAVLNETRSINKKLRQVLYDGGTRQSIYSTGDFDSLLLPMTPH